MSSGYLYLLNHRGGELFKVGISREPTGRLSTHRRQDFVVAEGTLYKLPIIEAARQIELLILRTLASARGEGADHITDGRTECFRTEFLNLVGSLLQAALLSPLGEGYEVCDIDGHCKTPSGANGWDNPKTRAERLDRPQVRVNGVLFPSFRDAHIAHFGEENAGRRRAERLEFKRLGQLLIQGLLFERV